MELNSVKYSIAETSKEYLDQFTQTSLVWVCVCDFVPGWPQIMLTWEEECNSTEQVTATC